MKKLKSIDLPAKLKNGKKVIIHSEIDGYKPMDVEVYDLDGNEVEVSEKESERLYELIYNKIVEKMAG